MAVTGAQSTITNLAAAYKDLFPQGRLDQLAMIDNPLLTWLPKKDDLEGDGLFIPMRYARPQGKSSVFTSMQAIVSGIAPTNDATFLSGHGRVKRVELLRKRYYGGVAVDDEAVRAARSRKGAFYAVKEAEMEDIIMELGQTLQQHLWLDGFGVLGVVSSISTDTVTLTNPEDVINFSIGQVLVASVTRSGGVLLDSGNDTVVTQIDYDAGTIDIDVSDISGLAATDFLFNKGDYFVTSTTVGDGNLVTGLAGWFPQTAETSGTFLGMERFDDISRLQGSRQTYLGSIEETIKKLHSKMRRISAKPDSIWVADDNWHRLELELGARATRLDGTAASFGLPSLKYASPKGSMSIFADPFCPEDVGYLLSRRSLTLHHLDGLPHIVMTDGNRWLRGADYDGVEMRARMWMELGCDAPKDNGRFVIG